MKLSRSIWSTRLPLAVMAATPFLVGGYFYAATRPVEPTIIMDWDRMVTAKRHVERVPATAEEINTLRRFMTDRPSQEALELYPDDINGFLSHFQTPNQALLYRVSRMDHVVAMEEKFGPHFEKIVSILAKELPASTIEEHWFWVLPSAREYLAIHYITLARYHLLNQNFLTSRDYLDKLYSPEMREIYGSNTTLHHPSIRALLFEIVSLPISSDEHVKFIKYVIQKAEPIDPYDLKIHLRHGFSHEDYHEQADIMELSALEHLFRGFHIDWRIFSPTRRSGLRRFAIEHYKANLDRNPYERLYRDFLSDYPVSQKIYFYGPNFDNNYRSIKSREIAETGSLLAVACKVIEFETGEYPTSLDDIFKDNRFAELREFVMSPLGRESQYQLGMVEIDAASSTLLLEPERAHISHNLLVGAERSGENTKLTISFHTMLWKTGWFDIRQLPEESIFDFLTARLGRIDRLEYTSTLDLSKSYSLLTEDGKGLDTSSEGWRKLMDEIASGYQSQTGRILVVAIGPSERFAIWTERAELDVFGNLYRMPPLLEATVPSELQRVTTNKFMLFP